MFPIFQVRAIRRPDQRVKAPQDEDGGAGADTEGWASETVVAETAEPAETTGLLGRVVRHHNSNSTGGVGDRSGQDGGDGRGGRSKGLLRSRITGAMLRECTQGLLRVTDDDFAHVGSLDREEGVACIATR